jgi:hypothetical protein
VTVVVGGEALVLLIFTLWGTIASPSTNGGVIIALVVALATAMGMQSVALHLLGVPGVSSTAINSTWIGVVSAISGRILMLRRRRPGAATGARVDVLVIGSYLVGAVTAAMAMSGWQLAVAAIPTGIVTLVAVIAFVRYQRSSA